MNPNIAAISEKIAKKVKSDVSLIPFDAIDIFLVCFDEFSLIDNCIHLLGMPHAESTFIMPEHSSRIDHCDISHGEMSQQRLPHIEPTLVIPEYSSRINCCDISHGEISQWRLKRGTSEFSHFVDLLWMASL